MAFEDELVGSAKPMTAPTAWREVVERTAKALQSAQARVIHEAQDEAARALGVSYPYYEDDRVPTWEDIGDAEREMYRRTADATLRALARPAGHEGEREVAFVISYQGVPRLQLRRGGPLDADSARLFALWLLKTFDPDYYDALDAGLGGRGR